jgi:hypothetical protein
VQPNIPPAREIGRDSKLNDGETIALVATALKATIDQLTSKKLAALVACLDEQERLVATPIGPAERNLLIRNITSLRTLCEQIRSDLDNAITTPPRGSEAPLSTLTTRFG